MATATDKLTWTKINAIAKGPAPAAPKKHADGGGLYLLHAPTGSLLWNMKFRVTGREARLSFGAFPEVSLAEARQRRDEARAILATGRDPREVKREAVASVHAAKLDTFRHFAEKLLAELKPGQAPATRAKWELHVNYAIARFGERPIGEIKLREIEEFLREFQAAGRLHTLHSVKRKLADVFRAARRAEATELNFTDDLAGVFMPAVDNHHPAITDPTRFAELLRAIDGHRGDPSVRGALQFLALTFQRPGMVRSMEWSEIDFEAKLWNVPAEKMKPRGGKKLAHVVPLSRQALAVLEAIRPITGVAERDGTPPGLVFPGRGGREPMSDAAMSMALRRLEFADHVAHGFRASANTMIKEQLGIEDQELIDLALAHAVKGPLGAAYNRVQYLSRRVELMDRWGDYLEALRNPPAPVRLRA